MPKIGLVIGMEQSWPRALSARAAELPDTTVDLVKFGGSSLDEVAEFDLIVDRISHEIPYFRSALSALEDAGKKVVNSPRRLSGQDRFTDRSKLARMGCKVPKTVLLPHKEYAETVTGASLRNLRYPLDWRGIVQTTGVPALLKSARFEAYAPERSIHSEEDLLRAFDRTGRQLVMLEQEFVAERTLRAYVFGGQRTVLARFDPTYRSVTLDPDYVSAATEEAAIRLASKAACALGYDLAAVELAEVQGELWVTDVVPAPDLEVSTLGTALHEKVVGAALAAFVELADPNCAPVHHHARRDGAQGLVATVVDPPAAPAAEGKTARPASKRSSGKGKGKSSSEPS